MGIRDEIKAIAEASPDFVYEMEGDICLYTNYDGTPGCIIGHWLHDKGIRRTGPIEGTSVGSHDFVEFVHAEGVNEDISPDDQAWLEWVQLSQDDGTPWGEAVASADGRLTATSS